MDAQQQFFQQQQQPQHPNLANQPNHGDMMASLQKPFQQIPSLPLPSAQLNNLNSNPNQQQFQATPLQQQQFNSLNPSGAFQPPPQQQQQPQSSAFNAIQPSVLQRPPPTQFSQANAPNAQQSLQQPQPPQMNHLNNPSLNRPPSSTLQQPLIQQGPPSSLNNLASSGGLNQQMSNLNLNNQPTQPQSNQPPFGNNVMNRNDSPLYSVSSQQQPGMPPISNNLSQPPMYNQQSQQQPMYQQQAPLMNGQPMGGPPPIRGANMPPAGPQSFQQQRPPSMPGQQAAYMQPMQQPYGMNQPPQAGIRQPYPMSGPMGQQQMYPGQQQQTPMYDNQQMPPPTSQMGQPQTTLPQPPQQQQQKMDMDQIPNPIEVMQANNSKCSGEFETNEAGKIPPLITTDFVCKDVGNSNPRFIRSTMYSVPANPDLMKQSKLPLVLNLTPFANLRPEEREPPVSNLGELGPVRCKRCKAYMSPFMSFIDNGKKFSCPFCDDVTQVPQEYFNHLDHMGRRIDMYERPELCLGSYEFVATKDYCRQQTLPQPPAFIFMIDVSVNSVRSGLLHVLCPYIKNVILPNLPVDKLAAPLQDGTPNQELRVGFVTYDKELHFYNLKSSLAAPQMMIVSDMEEIFVPILDGFLVKLSESKNVIDILLDTLPTMFEENKETELIFGPVIEAGIEALKTAKVSGKLFIFHSNLPNSPVPGQLKNRDDKKLLGTEKEKQILSPQNDYYGQLSKKCIENGCSVDLFLIPNQYCDLATLSDLLKKAGGQIYKYDYFTADLQGERICDDLKYAIESTVAFDAVMKIRTSTGIKPVDYFGNFNMYGNDVELAGLQKQTSLSCELKHEDKLNENSKVFIQLALLYTSLSGQRRIRIHNLSLSVCTQYSQMFSSCELDTLINYIAKLACRSITVSSPKSIRENLIQQVASILASYRKNCTNTPSKGQFILPETLKLLPVFSNSLLKSDAIAGSQNISVDERAWLMHRLMSMDIESTYAYFYPRLLPLHEMESPDVMPTPVRCIYERLKDDGIYLLENGLTMYLWLGMNVDPATIQNLFGVASAQQLNTEKCKLLELNTKISENVRSAIKMVNEQRKSNLKLIVVRQRENLEIFFKNLLVEDKGHMPNGSSYVEFLYQLHREIKNILS